MNVSLFQAAAAMSANARWQEAISENLASASIPGFKKQDLSFEAVQSGLMPQATPDPRMQFTMPRVVESTNFAQGPLRATGVKTDVAVDGRGFFEVQLPNGSTAFTRDGEFHVNANGQLTTKQGYLVLGESGSIQLDNKEGGQISISSTGEISQGAEVRAKMKLVDFSDPKQLTQIGGGLFVNNTSTMQGEQLAVPSVRQGYLEGANTSPVTEMANLITVMRNFESNQRLMQLHDERMGRTISELANPN